MSSRVDAVSQRVQTAVSTKRVTQSMAGVVHSMESAMKSMNLEQVISNFKKIEILHNYSNPLGFFFLSKDVQLDGSIRAAVRESGRANERDGRRHAVDNDHDHAAERGRHAHAASGRRSGHRTQPELAADPVERHRCLDRLARPRRTLAASTKTSSNIKHDTIKNNINTSYYNVYKFILHPK